jgi:Fic family protein
VGLREIHRRFCEQLPDILLWVEAPDGREPARVVPGAWRDRDVEVGRHLAISAGAVPRFMNRFEIAYRNLGPTNAILAAACAHHRLLWVHPFTDGNGRVARLMSHAILLETLGTGALWSVARGLARNAETYKRHLAACDQPRRNDLDGRGHLSQAALADFTAFFLDVCIDQVEFIGTLIQPEQLRTRIRGWAEDAIRQGTLPARADVILDALLYRGSLPRREVPAILGISERQARRILSALTSEGAISAETTRAPLQLAFPARLASRWMPGLFPDVAPTRD